MSYTDTYTQDEEHPIFIPLTTPAPEIPWTLGLLALASVIAVTAGFIIYTQS